MENRQSTRVADPELERQGKQLAAPVAGFVLTAIVLAVPGIVLLIVASSWAWALGLVLVVLAMPAAMVAVGALVSSAVARWAARHRLFA